VAKRISAAEAQHRAETIFHRGAASLTAPRLEFRAPSGDPIDAALAHMRCVDLAIIGQADIKDDKRGLTRRLAEDVVLGSGGPILLLPYAGTPVELGANVAIAWNAGREAARAVRDALPILATASRVTVVSMAHERDTQAAMAQSHVRLAAYLAAHAIEAQFKCLVGTSDEPGELLLSQAADVGADLIVMGGYGHARVRELVLGGTTRTMLESMTVPVLMSH